VDVTLVDCEVDDDAVYSPYRYFHMNYAARDDDDLMQIFRSGDVQGFNTLFNRYWRSLFVMAKDILEDGDLAQDAVQEVFASLYVRARKRSITNVRAYLYQAVKYQCFMQLRSGKISERHLSRMRRALSANPIEENIFAAELEAILMRKIAQLPEKCREVYYLSRFELMPNKKIAERLNISPKTVEHQLTKALKTLRVSVDKLAMLALFLALAKFFL